MTLHGGITAPLIRNFVLEESEWQGLGSCPFISKESTTST